MSGNNGSTKKGRTRRMSAWRKPVEQLTVGQAALVRLMEDLTKRIERIEQSPFMNRRNEHLRERAAMIAGNPGIPLFPD